MSKRDITGPDITISPAQPASRRVIVQLKVYTMKLHQRNTRLSTTKSLDNDAMSKLFAPVVAMRCWIVLGVDQLIGEMVGALGGTPLASSKPRGVRRIAKTT